MVEIRPIRGIFYNGEMFQATNMDKLFSPPYDVLTPEQIAGYKEHPYNAAHLVNAEDPAEAASKFQKWLDTGVLQQDSMPALYLYVQSFDANGERIRRTGLLAEMKLEDYSTGKVLPHENIATKVKDGRASLAESANADFDQIMLLYEDPLSAVPVLTKENRLILSYLDDDTGVATTIYGIYDPEQIKAIQRAVSEKITTDSPVIIADGHHRYQAALDHRDKTGYDYRTVVFFDRCFPEDFIMHPTHRLLKRVNFEKFSTAVDEHFRVDHFSIDTDELNNDGSGAFVYFEGKNSYKLTPLQDSNIPIIGAWKSLSVANADYLAEQSNAAGLSYTHDFGSAIQLVKTGAYSSAFFVQPTTIEEMLRVVEAGELMPKKSTFFAPKLPTGLIMTLHDSNNPK